MTGTLGGDMRRLFWTWNPVASVEFRPFDEPHVLADRFAVLDHMRETLDWYRQLEALESLHREPFRVLTGRCALACTWKDVRDALEQELSDYRNGITDRSYPLGTIQHRDSSMQPRGTLRLHD